MSYYQLNDIKRDRLPYATTNYWQRPIWAPEIYNTPYLNLRKTAVIAALSGAVVESLAHCRNYFYLFNYVYEYPKNTMQWSIYIREALKTPGFFGELRKKIVYGSVQHSLDAGFKIAMFHYIWGGTWAPKSFCDYNSIKIFFLSFLTGFLSGWTHYPLEVARKAYDADLTWPEEYRKGFRSPLHALLKIPFTDGPLYLFRGGSLHYIGNSIGLGWILFFYTWTMDKFSFVWRYNEVSYNYCKFLILNAAFGVAVMGSQPFIRMKYLMDEIPRERGGNTTFKSSWECFRYLKKNWSIATANLVTGYWNWFRQYGAVLYLTIWYADNMGLMDNYRVDPNTFDTTAYRYISD